MFEDDKELQQEQGVDQGVETSTSPETTAPPPERQPEKPKINLDDYEEFRKYKSEQDKRISALERQHRQQLAQEQQRRAAYEQQLEEKQLAGMDDYQKLQYRMGKLEQENTTLRTQRQQDEIDRARYVTLQEIVKQTGVPMELIIDAEDPTQAWATGAAYLRKQTAGGQQQQQEQDKRDRNAVDVGGGRTASAGDNDLQARYDRAMKRYDTGAALEIMHEADVRGIELKLYA